MKMRLSEFTHLFGLKESSPCTYSDDESSSRTWNTSAVCPTVRRILQLVSRERGYVFSPDGETPIGDGSWVKRQWRAAQAAAKVAQPISWHDLRHQFVSLLIAAAKHPKFIASAARHRDPGFSLRTYGHLFDSTPIVAVEWWDDLL